MKTIKWSAIAARTGFMKLLLSIFQFAFGCQHSRLSRVFTIKNRTYQVCFDCGREFEYSWAQMHSLELNVAKNSYTPLNSTERTDVSVFDLAAGDRQS
ncbi:MAG TPA: hypothetical protein VK699_13350 [Terriglobales bacterium]|nr:hypothetical protein [Terriglobales bacterium]